MNDIKQCEIDPGCWLPCEVNKLRAERDALKKDARLCTETLLNMSRESGFWISNYIEEAAGRILAATEGE